MCVVWCVVFGVVCVMVDGTLCVVYCVMYGYTVLCMGCDVCILCGLCVLCGVLRVVMWCMVCCVWYVLYGLVYGWCDMCYGVSAVWCVLYVCG